MNASRLPGSKTRITLWGLLWLIVLSLGGATMGLNGWPWRLAGLEARLYYENGWQHGAFTIEKLRASAPKSQRFVFIGGSACIEAITTDADAQTRLRALTDTRAEFASVCSSYTTLSDVAKIVDRIGPHGGTILLLVEPSVLARTRDIQLQRRVKSTGKLLPKYYFLALPDPVKATLKEQGLAIPFGYDILNYIKVAPGQLFKAVRKGAGRKSTYQRHLIKERRDEEKIIKSARNVPAPDNVAMNVALLRKVIEIAQAHGNAVSLVNLPNAEPYRADIAAALPSYDQIIGDLIEEYGTGHIDLRYAAPWPRDDFWDTHHMTPQGREKFTRLLVERLATLPPMGPGQ